MQEADLARGICGAHGGYKTAEMRDDRRIGGGCRLREGPGERVDGVSPEQPQSFEYQRRPVWTTAAQQDEEKWRRTVEQGTERFMAK